MAKKRQADLERWIIDKNGDRFKPHRNEIVRGTESLLAVTVPREGDLWSVTHVPTGSAFPLLFPSAIDATQAAKMLFKKLPRDLLKSDDIKEWERKMNLRHMCYFLGEKPPWK